MSQETRLPGIELCRGLAAFAVILVHSGDETWGVPISNQAIQFRHLFYYAVPFFLAVSFYFSTRRLHLNLDRSFWQKKLQRIIIPYLLWSAFYVISKTAIFTLANQTEPLQKLLSDPLAIIFLGAASYHLYFIPLLFAGTFLLWSMNYLLRLRNSTVWLVILSIISIIVYQLLIFYHNDFNLDSYTAFPGLLGLISSDSIAYQPLRIILVNISWMIRCSPYFFIALLINQLLNKNDYRWLYKKEMIAAIFLFFVLINIVAKKYLPLALTEVLVAYSLLLFSITISQQITSNNFISNLGLCSFGIYLVHPLIKSIVELVLVILLPQATQSVSILSILIYSISSFFLSWMFILLAQRNKFISLYV